MRLVTTLSLLAALTLPTPAPAQQTATKADPAHDAMHAAHHTMTPVHDSVMTVVKRLFDGMRTRDTAMMRSTFAPGTVLGGVPQGDRPVRFTPIEAFIAGIAAAPAGQLLNETLYDPEIRIDGGLATVWTFYTFHVGERLSHCGMDAFQLVRTSAGWKITALADTRQTTGCEVTGKKKA
jgi:hypothetical protein